MGCKCAQNVHVLWMSSSRKERTVTHSTAKDAPDDPTELSTVCSTSSRHQIYPSALKEASTLYQASLCPADDQYCISTWVPTPGWPPLQRTSLVSETDSSLEMIPLPGAISQARSSPLETPMPRPLEMTPQGHGTMLEMQLLTQMACSPVHIVEHCNGD